MMKLFCVFGCQGQFGYCIKISPNMGSVATHLAPTLICQIIRIRVIRCQKKVDKLGILQNHNHFVKPLFTEKDCFFLCDGFSWSHYKEFCSRMVSLLVLIRNISVCLNILSIYRQNKNFNLCSSNHKSVATLVMVWRKFLSCSITMFWPLKMNYFNVPFKNSNVG